MKTYFSPFAIPFRALFMVENRALDGDLLNQKLVGEQKNFLLHIGFYQNDLYIYKEAISLYILEDF